MDRRSFLSLVALDPRDFDDDVDEDLDDDESA
jgi:hypothetical protein